MAARVDLNSDLGEGFGPWRMGDDEGLLGVVTTANVACGFHAGDPLIMARTVALAREHGVAVGAHPGTLDLFGFGRRPIGGAPPAELATMVVYQVGALRAVAARAGVRVGHVKLHGALSNAAAVDATLASAIAEAICDVDPTLAWLVPSGSEMAAAARACGLRAVHEVFADRGYDDDGDLLARDRPGAVLTDTGAVVERALRIVEQGAVLSASGRPLPLRCDSLCVHGDTPGALETTRVLRAALEHAGVRVAAFAAS
ncbi:MAG TPA: 5-oxoprolinase subunit PxpA [Candidatus Dormibacteraeota bacterium]|nr:5-oxoprolinase subunit PxpA [Candidatus Dormibacteraeota bacterium]